MKKLTLAQVKALARKQGKVTVQLFPSNCGPSNTTWVQGVSVTVRHEQENGFVVYDEHGAMPLENVLNTFSHYNCNYELGYRIHYYMQEQPEVELKDMEQETEEIEDIEIELENPLAIIRKAHADLEHAETDQERDELYTTIQDNLMYQVVTKTHIMPTWYIFDHLYFDKETAELFEDGKERAYLQFIVAKEGDTVQEGTDVYTRHDSYGEALEELEEIQNGTI